MSALTTPLCDLLDIRVPVIQAPIGSAATPELVGAVSGYGGLGTLALTWTGPEGALNQISRVRAITDRPFAVNLVLDFSIEPVLDACLEQGVPIVSTFWGDPTRVSDRVHAAGALHLHSVGSVEEAERAVDAGVDVVVAQGCEAGGHVRGRTSTMVLTPAVVDAVGPVPVVAAGGIADGRGLAAVLALGAQAAWLGTRFLTAFEAATHESYRRAVVVAGSQDTVLTGCFDGGWPDAPHRALRNSTLCAWEDAGRPAAPHRPGEGETIATDDLGRAHLRYEDMIPTPGMSGDVEALALYAGQSAALVHDTAPAAEIMTKLCAEAVR